jgi:transposase
MQAITTIGLDIAKSVFQVHGVDADGQVVIRRKLKWNEIINAVGWIKGAVQGIFPELLDN